MSAGLKGIQRAAPKQALLVPRLQPILTPKQLREALWDIGQCEGAYVAPRSNSIPDGVAFGGLTDLSGNGRHLFQTGSTARPTLQTKGSRRVLRFDGSNDVLAGVGNGFYAEEFTAVIRWSAASNPGSNNAPWGLAGSAAGNDFTSGITMHMGGSTTTALNFIRTEGIKSAPVTDLYSGGTAFGEMVTMSLVSDASWTQLHVNGQADGVIASSNTVIEGLYFCMGNRFIGGSTAAAYCPCDIQSLFFFSKALKKDELRYAEALL